MPLPPITGSPTRTSPTSYGTGAPAGRWRSLQHRLLRFQAVAEGLDVTFHPAAEPVEFRLDEGEGLTASAKTSTVGPGYHAMLVELMETIGPAAGIDPNASSIGSLFFDQFQLTAQSFIIGRRPQFSTLPTNSRETGGFVRYAHLASPLQT